MLSLSRLRQSSHPLLAAVAAPAFIVMLSGCKRESAQEAPPPRPVRTVVVEKGGLGQ
jgi:hypothetical protein